VGTVTRPYGFTSPLAGTVEATLLTLVNLARNGPEVDVDSAGVLALAAELVLDELPVLLELPQPEIRYPCPVSQRSPVRWFKTASVSMPSAMTVGPVAQSSALPGLPGAAVRAGHRSRDRRGEHESAGARV